MNIELFYTASCHAYRRAMDELETALDEVGLPVKFTMMRIDKLSEAKSMKFAGSPAIHVNGEDIDPKAKEIKNFAVVACRPYFWEGKSYDWPPKAMIIEALKKKI